MCLGVFERWSSPRMTCDIFISMSSTTLTKWKIHEPAQPFINRSGRFLGVARSIRIFNTKNKGATVMSCEEPVEKRRARPANVQVTGRRWCEANADWGTHFTVTLSESEGPRKCCLAFANSLLIL